jgi:hypothetical protein
MEELALAYDYNTGAELYVKRLETLDGAASNRLGRIDKAAVGLPAVGVALIGITQGDSPSREIQQIVHTSLVLLAAGLVFYSYVQMRAVFIYAGQRKAIEEFAESEAILPKGLFSWESGPALEISGARRLDDKANESRYIQPAFLALLDAGMCGYALLKLQSLGIVTFWFIASSCLSVVSFVVVGWAFSLIPAAMNRVYCWTSCELKKNRRPELLRP